METNDLLELLLAARVREQAVKWRNHAHQHIEDTAEFKRAVEADPLDPYIAASVKELRRVSEIMRKT